MVRADRVVGPFPYRALFIDALSDLWQGPFDMVPVDRVECVQPGDLVLGLAVGLAFHLKHHLR